MIGKDEIAEATRYADAGAEEVGDIGVWFGQRGFDITGVGYVAQQRALRGALMLDGVDPSKLSPTEFTNVQLSDFATTMLPRLAMMWLDGFAAGCTVKPPKGQAQNEAL